jgi:conjugal transfer pilus assembly protein TraB
MAKMSGRAGQIRKKQFVVLGIALAIIAVASLGSGLLMEKRSTAVAVAAGPAPTTRAIVTGAVQYEDKEAWRSQVSSEVEELKKQLAEERKAREMPMPAGPRASEAAAEAGANIFAPPVPPPSMMGGSASGGPGGVPPPTKPTSRIAGAPPWVQGSTGQVSPPPVDFSSNKQSGPVAAKINKLTFDDPPEEQAQASGSEEESGGAGKERKKAGSYIPAGAFVRVVILNGLDAPTGGQAQSNPTPVLMKVMDSATLPNGFKADLRGCTISGNGYGDISSERALIRLDRLACISDDGGAIDIAVKGYVAGEDGKAGMRGRLVTKTGQLLANGLLAGIGSGIGQAFQNSATVVQTNPFGNQTQQIKPGEEVKAGLSSGVGKAFDQLAKYYIEQSNKIYPIIEVDGARVVDIVFSRGFVLEGR